MYFRRYLPSTKNSSGLDPSMCDPWQAEKFSSEMNHVPDTTCDKCLPDCQGTTYTATVTSVPFRKCDDKNMGVSFLCDLTGNDIVSPPIFAESLRQEYRDENDTVDEDKLPEYIKKKTSNWRLFSSKDNKLFGYEQEQYNAYERVRKKYFTL